MPSSGMLHHVALVRTAALSPRERTAVFSLARKLSGHHSWFKVTVLLGIESCFSGHIP
jgi:hypothetical protein